MSLNISSFFLYFKALIKDWKKSAWRFLFLISMSFLMVAIFFPAGFSLVSQKSMEGYVSRKSGNYDYRLRLPQEIYFKKTANFNLRNELDTFFEQNESKDHKENFYYALGSSYTWVQSAEATFFVRPYIYDEEKFPANKIVFKEQSSEFSWAEAPEKYIVINPILATELNIEIGDTLNLSGQDLVVYGFGITASSMFFTTTQTLQTIIDDKSDKPSSEKLAIAGDAFSYLYMKESMWEQVTPRMNNFNNEIYLKVKNSKINNMHVDSLIEDLDEYFSNKGIKSPMFLMTTTFYTSFDSGLLVQITILKMLVLVSAFLIMFISIILAQFILTKNSIKDHAKALKNIIFNSSTAEKGFLSSILFFDFSAVFSGAMIGFVYVKNTYPANVNLKNYFSAWTNNLWFSNDIFMIFVLLFAIIIPLLFLFVFYLTNYKIFATFLSRHKIERKIPGGLFEDWGLNVKNYFFGHTEFIWKKIGSPFSKFFSFFGPLFGIRYVRYGFIFSLFSIFIFFVIPLTLVFSNYTKNNITFFANEEQQISILNDSIFFDKNSKKIKSFIKFTDEEADYYEFFLSEKTDGTYDLQNSEFIHDVVAVAGNTNDNQAISKKIAIDDLRKFPELNGVVKLMENANIDDLSFGTYQTSEGDLLGLYLEYYDPVTRVNGMAFFFKDLHKHRDKFRFNIDSLSDSPGVYLPNYYSKKYKVGDEIQNLNFGSRGQEMINDKSFRIAGFLGAQYSTLPFLVADISLISVHINNIENTFNVILPGNNKKDTLVFNLALTNQNLNLSSISSSQSISFENLAYLIVPASYPKITFKQGNQFIAKFLMAEEKFISKIFFGIFLAFLLTLNALILFNFEKLKDDYRFLSKLGYRLNNIFASFIALFTSSYLMLVVPVFLIVFFLMLIGPGFFFSDRLYIALDYTLLYQLAFVGGTILMIVVNNLILWFFWIQPWKKKK